MSNTDRAKTVLILGGLQGLSRALALCFAMEGDTVALLDLEGGDEAAFAADFQALGLRPPLVVRSEGSASSHSDAILTPLRAVTDRVDVLILAHVRTAPVDSMDTWRERDLMDLVEANSWPLVHFCREIHEAFGTYPRRVLCLSRMGLERCPEGFEHAAATLSLNEVFVKYLTYHLYAEDVAFNVLRVDPEAGDTACQQAARTAYALTSGAMDAIRGQTLMVDSH